MARNFLAITAGIISCFLMIFAIEIIGHTLNPMPVSVYDTEAFKNYIQNEAPKSFYIIVLIGYTVGSFTGGFVTSFISSTKKIVHAMTVGGILMGIGMYNLTTLHYPSWIVICAFFTFLPPAYFGSIVSRNLFAKKQLSH